MKYEIKDIEAGKWVTVEAPGIAEAMLDYLPWPTLEVKIMWQPTQGIIDVIDLKTDFMYKLKVIG